MPNVWNGAGVTKLTPISRLRSSRSSISSVRTTPLTCGCQASVAIKTCGLREGSLLPVGGLATSERTGAFMGPTPRRSHSRVALHLHATPAPEAAGASDFAQAADLL